MWDVEDIGECDGDTALVDDNVAVYVALSSHLDGGVVAEGHSAQCQLLELVESGAV